VQRRDEDIVIVPDESTFSIIVYASRKNQEWIGRLIKNLDERRPQVLIDVTLVAITSSDQFTYDLEMISSLPNLNQTSGLLNSVAGTTSDSILTKLNSPTSDRNRFEDFKSSKGTGSFFYADNQVQGILTLMQEKKYGRVLSRPKILVNDNEEGTITTENTTYVSRTSSTTTPTGTNPVISDSVTFEAYPSGINLTIKPHISEGDLLRLEIKLDRSNQASAENLPSNSPPPDLSKNTLNTIVTVPDKSTIILGGIVQLDQGKGGTKVPLLGDLPIIGPLFRNINNSSSDTKLYIFVKAYVLRPSELEKGLPDLEKISVSQRVSFEKAETEFQKYKNWPGIKPKPMDPLKVLDAE
ncbi:MAG: hypothetical protein E4H40_07235, partial [Candidatus Brocadiia bacterium]